MVGKRTVFHCHSLKREVIPCFPDSIFLIIFIFPIKNSKSSFTNKYPNPPPTLPPQWCIFFYNNYANNGFYIFKYKKAGGQGGRRTSKKNPFLKYKKKANEKEIEGKTFSFYLNRNFSCCCCLPLLLGFSRTLYYFSFALLFFVFFFIHFYFSSFKE